MHAQVTLFPGDNGLLCVNAYTACGVLQYVISDRSISDTTVQPDSPCRVTIHTPPRC